jgi:hypothetical protein
MRSRKLSPKARRLARDRFKLYATAREMAIGKITARQPIRGLKEIIIRQPSINSTKPPMTPIDLYRAFLSLNPHPVELA